MGNRRCVICQEILTAYHECPLWALQAFERQDREQAQRDADFGRRLEDGFSMVHASQDYIERD